MDDPSGPSSPKSPSHREIPSPSLPDINLPPPPDENNENPPPQEPPLANNNENEGVYHQNDPSPASTASQPLSQGDDDHSSLSDSGDRFGLRYGFGRMSEMEDAMIAVPCFAGDMDFYAVYDGHCGNGVSHLCRDRMHVILADLVTSPDWDGNWIAALVSSFALMDQEACFYPGLQFSGSTALVALVGPDRIFVSNCGNSRAVISHGGFAVPVTVDHVDGRPDEMARIEALGGMILPAYLSDLVLTRSIGDPYLKPVLISRPEVVSINRTKGDEFLILATDGLWDNVSNVEACDAVRNCFTPRFSSLPSSGCCAEAAELLVDLAYSKECQDNISVIVVNLKDAVSDDES